MFFSHRPPNIFGMPYGYREGPASWYRSRYEHPFQFHPAYSRSMYEDDMDPYQHDHKYSRYHMKQEEQEDEQQEEIPHPRRTWNESRQYYPHPHSHQHQHPRYMHVHVKNMNEDADEEMDMDDEQQQEEIPRTRRTWNMNELRQHLHPHLHPRQQKHMYDEYEEMEPDEELYQPRAYLRDAWGYRQPVPSRPRSMSRDRVPPPPPPRRMPPPPPSPPRRVYGDDMHDFPPMLQEWDQPQPKNERHIPIRVVPTFTMTTVPTDREFDIPTRIMPSRSRLLTWPSRSSSQQQVEENDHSSAYPELSSLLQSNPDAIRPLLLRLLPLYEPYLRDALKQDKESNNGEKKGKNDQTNQEKKQNMNKNGTTHQDEKKQEPIIKKMTPIMTRVITPLQESKTPLEESKAYDIPPPPPEETPIEPRPAPARKQQIYAYKSCKTPKSSDNDGAKEKKDKDINSSNNTKSTTTAKTTTTDVSSSQAVKSTNTSSKAAAASAASTSTSTSRNIPIRDVTGAVPSTSTTSTSTSTKPSTVADSNKTSDTKTESYRPINIPIRDSRESDVAKKTTDNNNNITTTTTTNNNNNNNNNNTTNNNTNTTTKSSSNNTSAEVKKQEAEVPIRSIPITVRRSPNVEIEDVPPTPMHRSRTPAAAAEDTAMAPKPTSTSAPTAAPARVPTPNVETVETESTQPEKKVQEQQQQQQQLADEKSSESIPMTTDDDTSNKHDEKSEDLSNSATSSQVSVDSATIKEVETQDHDHDHDVDHSNQHSPTSSTYSSIMQSPTGSPSISTPASPDHNQHTRNDSDHEWQFTSPVTQSHVTQTNVLSQSSTHTVTMNKSMDQDGYVVTITLPEHITKHDIRLDHDDQTLHVVSIDDPPMFPPESMTLSSDADMEHLSAKSHLIGDFHTIVVKIPKRVINKRAIRIE